jgi:MYXO-CTERM domain-containing protein
MGSGRCATGIALCLALSAHAAAPPGVSTTQPRKLSFEPNVGQLEPQVRFLARGRGGTLFLTDSEAVLALRGEQRAVRLRWPGGRAVVPQGAAVSEAWVQRFEGADPSRWRSPIPTYRAVRYPEIYPGIDLLFESRDGEVEFTFELRPGADSRRIRLSFEGAVAEGSGDAVILRAGGRQVRVLAPEAFELEPDGRRPLRAALRRTGSGTWGFAIGPHRPGAALLIDPVLAYGTYLGGNGADQANALALDAAGNVYVAGSTSSTNFPKVDALMPYDAGDDAFLSSFDPSGQTLRFSTYLGGSDEDEAFAVAVDGSGAVYLGGKTRSADFPVRNNPYSYGGSFDGFLTKLVPADAGFAIAYSTWIGSPGNDQVSALAVDDAGYLVLAGCMALNGGVVPWRALRSGVVGGDAFVACLAPSGFGVATAPTFFTYVGGSGSDCASSLALDGQGAVTVGGMTQSTDFPTVNAFQRDAGGNVDGFVTTLASGGQSLLFSTYLGGRGIDMVNGVAVDGSGRLSAVGATDSPDFPVTPGSFQPFLRRDAGYDAFFVQISSGGALTYSTYFGGSSGDAALAVAAAPAGATFVAGWTGSGDFPLLNSLQSRVLSRDAFLLLFDATPTLIYSTVYGGSGDENARAAAVGASASAWIAGDTSSSDLPTQQPWQRSFDGGVDGGDTDAFLARISLPPPQVAQFQPDGGPDYGGTVVSFIGSGFLAQTQVTFGGADASVTPTPPSNLSAATPAHAPGAVDIVISNPDGQQVRLPAAFTYYGAPIAVVSPASVTVDAGQPFTLDGTGSTPSPGATLTTFVWSEPAGPAAISFDAGATQALALDEPGAYQVGLQVADSSGVRSQVALATIQVQGPASTLPPYRFGCGCAAGGGEAALAWVLGLGALRGRRKAIPRKLR